ncbi:MAG TPA: dihydropteroate synthase [Actinomycetota bacterium]|nr:dihydropteroate synthase [Actinomycetota bacterium]
MRNRPFGPRTAVMGILNVTPDSFHDGGRYDRVDLAAAHAEQMVSEGADLIDVGGESTRPGAAEVSVQEEMRRVVPVVEAVSRLGPAVSIDTRKAEVAEAALDAGATIVNDVSAGAYDSGMLAMIARRGATVILMHMRGAPATMDSLTGYGDVFRDVATELSLRVRAATEAGVPSERILVDPGLGFAKTAEQSLQLLRRAEELRGLAAGVVVGPSRKRFVGHVTGEDRLEGTAAAVAWCAVRGVDVVRVHDVRMMRRVVDMISAISKSGEPAMVAEGAGV